MAVDKDGVKHACMHCIRGHRVKKCNHLDRPLIPLLKRGRQVSQCNHCRELRSSGSHVKCTCATSAVPNPQNGCLCEVVQICTCVARHLQNTQTTMNRNPVALLASDTASPLSLPSTSPAMGEDDPAQHLPELPATGDTISAITATTNSTTRSTLGTGNMDQHNFLQSTFPSAGMIHAPPYEVRVGDTINQKYALSFNTQLDAPPQRNIFHPAFDNVQMDPTLTSLSTATKTTNRSDGTIDILDLFLHQDINDLLSL